MTKSATVTFDGKALNPSTSLDLERNRTYRITIEPVAEEPRDAWEFLESKAGSVEAPEDWSKEHDHYLYGTPKRSE